MTTEYNFIPIVLLIALLVSGFVGTVYGLGLGEKSATRETVRLCVEQPSACKTKYDYYKLEDKK